MSALSLGPSRRRVVQLLALLIAAPLTIGLLGHLQPSVAAVARSLSPLALQPSTGSGAQALSIFAHNLRVVALPLLGAAALAGLRCRPRVRDTLRGLLDAVICLSLVGNVTLLTLSLAGYGLARLAPWLPHLPVEFAALAIALDVYLTARGGGALSTRLLLVAAGACVVALALAAVIETYATPGA
jgi:ABC-type glycerol-3-phosphate transport system permease component